MQLWTYYVKAFESYCLTDRQTHTIEIIYHAASRVVKQKDLNDRSTLNWHTTLKTKIKMSPMEAQNCAMPSILALKQFAVIDPIPLVWEVWTRPHAVCCAASRYLSHTGEVESEYARLKIPKQLSMSKVKVICRQNRTILFLSCYGTPKQLDMVFTMAFAALKTSNWIRLGDT